MTDHRAKRQERIGSQIWQRMMWRKSREPRTNVKIDENWEIQTGLDDFPDDPNDKWDDNDDGHDGNSRRVAH